MNIHSIKRSLILLFACCISTPGIAQNLEDDALLYTQSGLIGTARIQSIGGAQVALGGDLGTFGINPAGVAMYRSSDLGISFGYNNISNKANYLGTGTSENYGKFSVPQFGVVFAGSGRQNDGSFNNRRWNNFSFGISHLKTHDFSNKYIYEGFNENSSITSFFADRAYQTYGGNPPPQEYIDNPYGLEDAAYAAGVISTAEIDGQPTYVGLSEFGNISQMREHELKGGVSETSLTLGGNYGNQLYIGGSLSYVNIRQNTTSYFSEFNIDDPSYEFDITSFDYIREYNERGAGFNAKLGFIYLPVEDLRIGAGIQSPSFIKFEEDFLDEIVTLESNGASYSGLIEGVFDYQIRTPMKINGGLAKFFGNQGFLAADVEYVNYANIHFDSDDRNTNTIVNDEIEALYQNAINARIGGEYKIDLISLRLGYAYFGNPYQESPSDYSRNYFTGGIGYRYHKVYLDLAGIYSQSSSTHTPYISADAAPTAEIDHNQFRLMLTVGTRF